MSLGNVLAVAYATQREKLTFLEEEDKVGTGLSGSGKADSPELGQKQSVAPVLATSQLCDHVPLWTCVSSVITRGGHSSFPGLCKGYLGYVPTWHGHHDGPLPRT